MAGNTRRARSNGNLLLDSDPDDDTTIDNSLDTAYLLIADSRGTPSLRSLSKQPVSHVLHAVGHAHSSPRSPDGDQWSSPQRHARSSPLVNSTTG
jgi:hypothetical protein